MGFGDFDRSRVERQVEQVLASQAKCARTATGVRGAHRRSISAATRGATADGLMPPAQPAALSRRRRAA